MLLNADVRRPRYVTKSERGGRREPDRGREGESQTEGGKERARQREGRREPDRGREGESQTEGGKERARQREGRQVRMKSNAGIDRHMDRQGIETEGEVHEHRHKTA